MVSLWRMKALVVPVANIFVNMSAGFSSGDPFRGDLWVFENVVFHKHFFVCNVAGSVAVGCALHEMDCDLIVHLQLCWFLLLETKFVEKFACPESLLGGKAGGQVFRFCY